ncbi:GTA-gp10 family protein [Alicyclobacillus contaminans]|uniref:GTA-gp10 family protein n=1 Tax=Alicyclobacillus contaminans TaxID=392016 RepID=UPI00047D2EA3|nr:GTA-gp10 family protein [Alicyclobacillus contaminans]
MPVSDVRVKPIPITLEKERTLKYDLNAFAELEERFGTVQQAFDELQKQKLKAVRAIVWAGLIHEDPKLTERQVGSMLSFADLTGILPAVTEAITAALPKASEDATEKNS